MTPASPGIGDVLEGTFRLDRELGEGAMGVIYEATDTTLGRKVAIKIAHRELGGDPVVRERLLREARAAAALTSEHVTRVYHAGLTAEGAPYVAMELLRGHSLEELARRGPLPVVDAVTWVAQAARGLAEAHAHGLVHRDVKPANLFVTTRPDGARVLKVLDFGIVRRTDPDVARLTATGEQPGSPAYMSPEQIRGSVADARADVWALGVTLFEALSGGALPFDGKTVTEVFGKILDEPPASLDRPDVPAAVTAVILRCLEKDPDRRFPSGREVADALDAALTPSAPEVRHVIRAAAPARGGKRTLIFAVSTLVVLVAGVALLVRTLPTSPSSRARANPEAPAPPPMVHSGGSAEPETVDAALPLLDATMTAPAVSVSATPSPFRLCSRPTDCKDPMTVCVQGRCVCVDGARLCGSVCRDRKDPKHCGACDNECPPSAVCHTDRGGSRCVECGSETGRNDGRRRLCGWHNCVSIDYDSENCGECGVRCLGDTLCHGGTCVPAK